MAIPSGARRSVATCLCWSFLIPMLPLPAQATDPTKFVIVEPGQPTIWSLGQAHYLLANMHQRNRELSTRLPNENDLDPNRANASRLETLRRALRFEAQFDESIGEKNDLETQRFRREETRQETARIALEERRQERTKVENELLVINEELTRLQELDRQSTEARGRTTPPTPPSAEDNERKLRIELLKVRKAQKDTEKTRLDSEITALTTTATTNPTLPDFQTAALSEGSGGLPESAAFDAFVEKALDSFSSPTLAASTTLDNFVQMQYEIISKQLTLLRDETGPDERIIFLELPASIYSVDDWGDDYVAEVEWEVTRYFNKVPDSVKLRFMNEASQNIYYSDSVCIKDENSKADTSAQDPKSNDASDESDRRTDLQQCPVTMEMVMAAQELGKNVWEGGHQRVRAIDIIPRQSALNVNQHHAAVKNVGVLGFLRFLSGFGAKVDFQNQKEMYEQFIQQEIFASGYGKGTNKFGWTFGPLPGSKRVAPGQRTTYAVLAVPRDTLALELIPKSRVFKRTKTRPERAKEGERIVVRVPGPQTDGFWIDEVSYAPVTKGGRVTALLKGLYFSPQLGVLVNGVPLQKVVSITRAGSKEPAGALTPGIHGEYEFTNSRQIVLSFTMGNDYVGTPIITLVTPDKSSEINYFDLRINELRDTSLDDLSLRNPMFADLFEVKPELEILEKREFTIERDGASKKVEFLAASLSGKGLRPKANVFINGRQIRSYRYPESRESLRSRFDQPKEFAIQESTGNYLLYFRVPGAELNVRFQQPTRQGFEEKSFKQVLFTPFSHKVRHYRRGDRGNPAEVHLTFTDRENTVESVRLTEPPLPNGCPRLVKEGNNFRATCMIPPLGGRIERDFITVEVVRRSASGTATSKFVDIDLPIQPVVATVINPRTGHASGFADEQPMVTISGVNLQNVTAVIFGEQAVKLPASGSSEVIAVRVPKAEGIPPGQSIVVPVLFHTSTDGEARLPSGAFYTFFGPPLHPSYVTWPCVAGTPCPQPAGGRP